MIKVGIIGYGNMGQAIGERIKHNYAVYVFDKDKNKISVLKDITAADTSGELVKQSEIIILAIKPQDFDLLLDEIKIFIKNKLIISIAAGVTTQYIRSKLGEKTRVVRVMPNLPAKIGEGMICLSKGKLVFKKDLDLTKEIFNYMGKTMVVNNEDMMDDVTAVSGSGPGYYYNFCPDTYVSQRHIDFEDNYFIPSLSASAVAIGFSKTQADLLAKTTGEGSRILFIKEKGTPAKLRKQVTSKGGTTAEALKVFRKAGSRKPGKKIWIRAIKAAVKRAKELSKV